MSRYGIVLIVALAGPAHAQVVSYDALAFPEENGDWIRRDLPFLAERFLEQNRDSETWLVHHAGTVDPGPPQVGEQDLYDHSLSMLAGSDDFFVQWRMYTDGSSKGIPDVAPAALVASGFAGILYHFTIAVDRVRFIRDALLPVIFVDVEPGVPHVYRLELFSDDLYVWYVDGEIIDAGIPEGPYPTSDSVLVFGVEAGFDDETTRWDYIRFGVIPVPGAGDWDSDGDLDLDDFQFFRECLSNSGPTDDAGAGCVWADMDQDDDVDFHDLRLFQIGFTGSE